MCTRITVLVENIPASDRALVKGAHSVLGEHGLSILVDFKGYPLLFDTGAGPLIVKNAEALGWGHFLDRLEAIVVSHGHFDHTGGLGEVLTRLNRKITVYVLPGVFSPKVRRKGKKVRSIGNPFNQSELEDLGARFVEKTESTQIGPSLFLTGPIVRHEQWEDMEPDLCIRTRGGEIVTDPFEEEQVLCESTEKGLIIFVGCAHRGLVNSIRAAMEATGTSRVRAIFGGAHLRSASEERIKRTADAVAELDPELVALGHCTGEKAEQHFSGRLGNRFSPLRAGSNWTLE